MYISAIKVANTGKGVNQNTSKNKMSYSAMKMSKTSKGDSVSFGALDPLTATIVSGILEEASTGAARGIFGIGKLKNAIKRAEALFDRYDVRPAIEAALKLDAAHSQNLLLNTDNILNKAIIHSKKFSDNLSENQDLKRRVAEHCYLERYDLLSETRTLAEDFFISLNNKIYANFKKHLLTKISEKNLEKHGQQGLPNFRDIDSVLNGVGDEEFKANIKARRAQQKEELASFYTIHGYDNPTWSPM